MTPSKKALITAPGKVLDDFLCAEVAYEGAASLRETKLCTRSLEEAGASEQPPFESISTLSERR